MEINMSPKKWMIISVIVFLVMAIIFSLYMGYPGDVDFSLLLLLIVSSAISIVLFFHYVTKVMKKEEVIYSPYLISLCSSLVLTTLFLDFADIINDNIISAGYTMFILFLLSVFIVLVVFARQYIRYGKKSIVFISIILIIFFIFISGFTVVIVDNSYEKGQQDMLPGFISTMQIYQKQFDVVPAIDDTVINISSIIGTNYSVTKKYVFETTIYLVNTRAVEKNYTFLPGLSSKIMDYVDLSIDNGTETIVIHDASNETQHYHQYTDNLDPHSINSYGFIVTIYESPELVWQPDCCSGNIIQICNIMFNTIVE